MPGPLIPDPRTPGTLIPPDSPLGVTDWLRRPAYVISEMTYYVYKLCFTL